MPGCEVDMPAILRLVPDVVRLITLARINRPSE